MTDAAASPASVPVSDGSESVSSAPLAATCDDHHIFPRDAFARLARAEVWCDKPAEHKGPHSAVKGSMLLVWRDKP